jgi:hypothetical protein
MTESVTDILPAASSDNNLGKKFGKDIGYMTFFPNYKNKREFSNLDQLK